MKKKCNCWSIKECLTVKMLLQIAVEERASDWALIHWTVLFTYLFIHSKPFNKSEWSQSSIITLITLMLLNVHRYFKCTVRMTLKIQGSI